MGGSEGFLDSAAGMGWVVVGALGGTVVFLSLAVGAAFTGSVAFVVADGAVVSLALAVGAAFTGSVAFAVADGAVVPGALAGSVGFLASAVAGAFASLGVLGASTGFFWSTGRVSAWVVEGALGGAVVSFALVVGATFTGTSAFAVAVVGAVLLGALAGSVGFLTSAEIGGAFVFDSLFSGMKFLLCSQIVEMRPHSGRIRSGGKRPEPITSLPLPI